MTTLTSTACQTFGTTGFFINPPRYLEEGVVSRSTTYTFNAAQSVGDCVLMVPIPRGAQFIDAIGQVPGGASITVSIGTPANTAQFAVSLSFGTQATARANRGLGYSFSADSVIAVYPTTVTSASAAGTMTLTVLYQMDNNQKG